jgi:hypothetical protein
MNLAGVLDRGMNGVLDQEVEEMHQPVLAFRPAMAA